MGPVETGLLPLCPFLCPTLASGPRCLSLPQDRKRRLASLPPLSSPFSHHLPSPSQLPLVPIFQPGKLRLKAGVDLI